MPNGKKDYMAQAVYLAQLQANKGNCQCNTCKILRKATEQMTADFLQDKPMPGAGTPEGITPLTPPEAEEG